MTYWAWLPLFFIIHLLTSFDGGYIHQEHVLFFFLKETIKGVHNSNTRCKVGWPILMRAWGVYSSRVLGVNDRRILTLKESRIKYFLFDLTESVPWFRYGIFSERLRRPFDDVLNCSMHWKGTTVFAGMQCASSACSSEWVAFYYYYY